MPVWQQLNHSPFGNVCCDDVAGQNGDAMAHARGLNAKFVGVCEHLRARCLELKHLSVLSE